ncbi:hypothetical protein Trydic_g18622, partial [Trypoxylus dichotomus]
VLALTAAVVGRKSAARTLALAQKKQHYKKADSTGDDPPIAAAVAAAFILIWWIPLFSSRFRGLDVVATSDGERVLDGEVTPPQVAAGERGKMEKIGAVETTKD